MIRPKTRVGPRGIHRQMVMETSTSKGGKDEDEDESVVIGKQRPDQ